MMEKISISDASIAEAIRGQMPVATSEKNGLMSISDRNRQRVYYVKSGEEIDTGINHAGIISIVALNLTGSPAIGISATNSDYVAVLYAGAGSIAFIESPDILCCFKKEVTGTFFLKNNAKINTTAVIAIL